MSVKSTVVWVATIAMMSSALPALAVDQGDIDNLQGQIDGLHNDNQEYLNDTQNQIDSINGDIQELHDDIEASDNWHNSQHDKLELRVNNNESEISRNFQEHEQLNNDVTDAKTSANNAVTTANDAKNEANQANTTAANAQDLAQAANTHVDAVSGRVDQQNQTLTQHEGGIASAQNTANAANGEAGKAMSQATQAQGTADTAQRSTQINAADIQTIRSNTREIDDRIHQGSDRAVQQANAYTDSRLKESDRRIDNVRREARSGIAGVAAMANIPQIPNKDYTVGVGAGHYMDRTAVALGAVIRSSESTAWKISAASDGNTPTYGLGFATGF